MKTQTKNLIFILFISASTQLGCNYTGIKVKGNWNIQSYEADFELITRTFNLKNDNTCELPLTDSNDRNTSQVIGTWDSYNKGDKIILVITSDNKKLEGEYEMSNWRRELDEESYGYFIKATFSNDNVVFNCAKAAN